MSELCVNTVCACSLVRDGLVCGTSFFDPLSTSVFCPSPGLFTLFTIHVLNLFLVLGPVFSTERSAVFVSPLLSFLIVSFCVIMSGEGCTKACQSMATSLSSLVQVNTQRIRARQVIVCLSSDLACYRIRQIVPRSTSGQHGPLRMVTGQRIRELWSS